MINHVCDECGYDEDYDTERRRQCPWCDEGTMRLAERCDDEDESEGEMR